MNPRKKISQMAAAERNQFLSDLTAEISQPTFSPVKKVVLEKVIEYINSSSKANSDRYEVCDEIFGAKNFAVVPFLQTAVRAVEQITDQDSKLRKTVLEEAVKRLTAIMERETNNTTAASVVIIASSILANSWVSAGLMLAIGAALFKYSEGLTQVRAAQALDEQSKKPLLGDQVTRLDSNFGDVIENGTSAAKATAVSFFNKGLEVADVGYQAAKKKMGF